MRASVHVASLIAVAAFGCGSRTSVALDATPDAANAAAPGTTSTVPSPGAPTVSTGGVPKSPGNVAPTSSPGVTQAPDYDPCAPPFIATRVGTRLVGTISRWLETSRALVFSRAGFAPIPDAAQNVGRAAWSMAGYVESGNFYGWDGDGFGTTLVAVAEGTVTVDQIRDARMLAYSRGTGIVNVGSFVVFHHVDTDVFMALHFLGARDYHDPVCVASHSLGDFDFYILADGTADFSLYAGL